MLGTRRRAGAARKQENPATPRTLPGARLAGGSGSQGPSAPKKLCRTRKSALYVNLAIAIDQFEIKLEKCLNMYLFIKI